MYCRFDTAHNGLRAFAKNLWSYYNKDNCKNLEQIIKRHAPSNENDTKAYIDDVCERLSCLPQEEYDINDKSETIFLMFAMIEHENGISPYSYNDVNGALMDTGHWQ